MPENCAARQAGIAAHKNPEIPASSIAGLIASIEKKITPGDPSL
jgi:hypothetical protein